MKILIWKREQSEATSHHWSVLIPHTRWVEILRSSYSVWGMLFRPWLHTMGIYFLSSIFPFPMALGSTFEMSFLCHHLTLSHLRRAVRICLPWGLDSLLSLFFVLWGLENQYFYVLNSPMLFGPYSWLWEIQPSKNLADFSIFPGSKYFWTIM